MADNTAKAPASEGYTPAPVEDMPIFQLLVLQVL
jgi:hypothetical protein